MTQKILSCKRLSELDWTQVPAHAKYMLCIMRKNKTIHISQYGTRSPGWPQRSCTSCSIIHPRAYVAFFFSSRKGQLRMARWAVTAHGFQMVQKVGQTGAEWRRFLHIWTDLMDSEGSSYASLVEAENHMERNSCRHSSCCWTWGRKTAKHKLILAFKPPPPPKIIYIHLYLALIKTIFFLLDASETTVKKALSFFSRALLNDFKINSLLCSKHHLNASGRQRQTQSYWLWWRFSDLPIIRAPAGRTSAGGQEQKCGRK